MPLIPRLMWKVVRDRVAHRHDWWGNLDSVWQRETHASNWDSTWMALMATRVVTWFQICRLWEFPVQSTSGFVLFNSIIRQLFTLWQCRISSPLRCELSHKSELWRTVQGFGGGENLPSVRCLVLSSLDTLKIATNSRVGVVDWWKEGAGRNMSTLNTLNVE